MPDVPVRKWAQVAARIGAGPSADDSRAWLPKVLNRYATWDATPYTAADTP
jgi:hypothetical protein